ncbi:FAD dependent oxidoreductase [Aspergillus cavernicola]|uniref:FAD dependent oxidoreductase n=1 Tax=Aspergillus cavernicola TaxID=176166 RepID=A0ABR4J2M6_9EURO
MSYLPKQSPILIIGTGTFGLSTAVHLARRGFTNIQCLDRWPYPSPDSAGYDINKIIGMRNDTPVTARVSREALAGWQEPLFESVWHEVGLITSGTTDEATKYCRQAYQSWVDCGEGGNVRWLETKGDFQALVPQLRDGSIPNWRGFHHKRAGWAYAKEALRIMGDEAARLGVRFATGRSATMKTMLLDDQNQAIGIIAEDGTRWTADRIVLCTGAWSDALVDMEGQLQAKCWTLAHIQLTPEECAELKGIPIVMNLDEGFFFEASIDGQVKICNEFPGFTHKVTLPDGRETSEPRSHAQNPGDTIPHQSRREIRELLAKTMPRFKDRPFVTEKVCWCTDTRDRNWLVDVHPVHSRLVLATGDSGNAFKMLPVMGKYIGDLVEGKSLDPMLQETWRWRPDRKGCETRLGGNGRTDDLKDMDGWTHAVPYKL